MATVPRASLGEWLKQARVARGLSIDAITRQTMISRRHIEALEHDVTGLLPYFYERAEVRAFARAVGVDERLAIEHLDAVAAPPKAAARPTPQLTVRFPLASAVLAVVAVALVAWIAGQTRAREDQAPWIAAARSRTDSTPAVTNTSAVEPTRRPIVSRAASAEVVTQLVIMTRPEGARVTVDGIGWGTSPLAIRHLPPGDKRIRVSKTGYTSIERVLAVEGRERESVEIALPPLPGHR